MLRIVIPAKQGIELWDEEQEMFIQTPSFKEQTLQLEHSLVSLSKWESKWNKPFLTKTEKTIEETLDYIKCMTLTQNVPPEAYNNLTEDNLKQINEYIGAPMTATYISEDKSAKGSHETVTSELIYYWMIALNIPFECQKWHLNRLLTLVKVCNVKNAPPKKMGKKALMSRNAALNAARKQQLGTRG
jgi:hypothetical protein